MHLGRRGFADVCGILMFSLLETSALLVVTSALLLVTRSYLKLVTSIVRHLLLEAMHLLLVASCSYIVVMIIMYGLFN